ncbi:hypothetical protein NQ315_013732, partial [Exocentrus adspersus]
PITPVILDQSYIHLKNLIIKAERRVLKELGFCVHIKHPHKIIVMYLQVLGFQNNQKLMQYSWNYMNDALRTDVFVRYQPETVACACIYLTARKLKLPLPKSPYWYTIFGATEAEIRDICVKILKLYTRAKANIESLEKKVEELCKKYQDARAKARGNSGNNTPNNNDSSSPNQQKTTGAHNAWGGFISRSGSHIAPPVSEKRSRSRSATHSPENKHRKRSKKHRSRSRSINRNHKKSHKRKSYSRSRSNSPHSKSRKRDKRRSRSNSNDRDKNDRYADKYDKYEKERYKDDRDKYSEKDRYEDKKDRKDKYDRDDKYKDRDDKYRDDRDRYKKSRHRDEEKVESRSKDRRR